MGTTEHWFLGYIIHYSALFRSAAVDVVDLLLGKGLATVARRQLPVLDGRRPVSGLFGTPWRTSYPQRFMAGQYGYAMFIAFVPEH